MMSAAVCSMLLGTSCQNEEIVSQSTEKNEYTLTLDMGSQSRTLLDENGKPIWGEDESLSVVGDGGNSYGELKMIWKSTDGKKAMFSGKITGDADKLQYMVYPVPNEDNKIITEEGKFNAVSHNAPMIGTIDDATVNKLNYAGGLVEINIDGLSDTDVVKIKVAGHYEFDVENGTLNFVEDENGGTFVTVSGAQAGSVFLPVPATSTAAENMDIVISINGVEETLEDVPVAKGRLSDDDVPNVIVTKDGVNTSVSVSAVVNEKMTPEQFKSLLAQGGDIKLADNIELEGDLELVTSTTPTSLDLNGKLLGLQGNTIQVSGALTIANGKIYSNNDVLKALSNSNITIKNDVELKSWDGNCCIFVPKDVQNVTVTTAGKLYTSLGQHAENDYAPIQVNGNIDKDDDIEINVIGGEVKRADNTAIYIAGYTELNISGNVMIEGTTGVEIRAGILNVSGGTITATGNPFTSTENGNGSTSVGAAIAVCQHTTNYELSANITGGMFNGIRALYEEDLEDEAATDKIHLAVSGGEFHGEIYSENCENFVTGGIFSHPSAGRYMGDNANIEIRMDKSCSAPGFIVKAGQTVVMTVQKDCEYNVTAPLVGSKGTETLGFQFKKDSNVTIQGDGLITSSAAKMLINNYGNLTLDHVILKPNAIPDMKKKDSDELQPYYVLSNNCGNITLRSATITAPETKVEGQVVFAMDVCKYSTYPEVHVNVTDKSTINGDIEYTGEGEGQTLTISGSTINGDLVVAADKVDAAKAAIQLTNGTTVNGEGWNIF